MGLFAGLANIDGAVESSKAQLAATCLSAEKSASVLASMPYYSATAANKLTAQSATAYVLLSSLEPQLTLASEWFEESPT